MKSLANFLENISKLELLENLNIKSLGSLSTFTEQEIESLSKMYKLKNLNIMISKYCDEKYEFDQEILEILRNLLPNTNVNILIENHSRPSDDW